MNVVDQIHGGYVHQRRVRVLRDHLARLLPDAGEVLDVGCGDGMLAKLIQDRKPGATISGIDVLVRGETAVPVTEFDGVAIPFPDASFDSVMFVDVLHHTNDPMVLLREAARVSRGAIVLKDHTLNGWLAGPTLRFMDRVGNLRHNVVLPHNYWPYRRWAAAFRELGVSLETWISDVGLYPAPASWIFGRSLHFIARLEKSNNSI